MEQLVLENLSITLIYFNHGKKKSSLVIVYHRQPYEEVKVKGKTVFKENKSPNGIVPALKGFFRCSR